MTTPCFCFEPLTLILTTFVKTMDRQGDDNNVASDQHKNSRLCDCLRPKNKLDFDF